MSEERDRKGRFRPGRSGNPKGRPAGARNKASSMLEQLLAGSAEQIMAAAIALATSGDPRAIKLCVDRLLPPLRNRTVSLSTGPLDAIGDPAALADVYNAATRGEIAPAEAESLAKVVQIHILAAGLEDLGRRVLEMEAFLARLPSSVRSLLLTPAEHPNPQEGKDDKT